MGYSIISQDYGATVSVVVVIFSAGIGVAIRLLCLAQLLQIGPAKGRINVGRNEKTVKDSLVAISTSVQHF